MDNIKDYLKKLSINKGLEELSDTEVKELLKEAVINFKDSKISLDELTDICEILWSEVYHQNKITGDSINLVSAGLELQYNLRRIENEENASIFISNLRTLLSLV